MNKIFTATILSLSMMCSSLFAQTAKKQVVQESQFSKTTVEMKSLKSTQSVDFRRKATALRPQQSINQLKLVSVTASQDPTKAKIRLVVDSVWGDGTGYQILMDSDANIFDRFFNDPAAGLNQDSLPALYAAAEVKIPTNATPVYTDGHSVLDMESDSLEIAPGTYDYVIVNPSANSYTGAPHVYIASGEDARGDNFTFEAGYTYTFKLVMNGYYDNVIFNMPVEIAVTGIELPTSGCQLTEAEIGISYKNDGSVALTEDMEVFYTVEGTTDSVKEKVTPPAVGKEGTHTFATPLALTKGEVTNIIAGVLPVAKEGKTSNNYASGVVFAHDPIVVPHAFDLEKSEFISAPGAWEVDVTEDGSMIYVAATEDDVPLISSCLNLPAGTYRLSYVYNLGVNFWGIFQMDGAYEVGFGKTSESIEDWEIVHEETGFIVGTPVQEVTVTVTEEDVYGFFFRTVESDAGASLVLTNLKINAVEDYDVRINNFTSALPRVMPVEHVNNKFMSEVTIENRGAKNIDKAKITVKMDGTTIGSKEVALGAAGEIAIAEVELTISGLKVGDRKNIVAEVEIVDHELADITEDNTYEFSLEVSRDLMAYDHVTSDMYTAEYGIGAQGSIGCGLPFTIYAQDTLTGVSLGWAPANDMEVGLTIHHFDLATGVLGEQIYEQKVQRGDAGGQKDYNFPSALLLEPGTYMISAVQLGSTSYGLIADMTPNGVLYVTTADPINVQTNLGYPAIRALFAPNAKIMAKDVEVKAITKPKERGLFSANETIEVELLNHGYQDVTTSINVEVDGVALTAQDIDIVGYGSAVVTFEADLSTPDKTYELKAISTMDGDQDPSNNVCTKSVYHMAPADPYTMDFEYTEDFAITGFNPAWTTYDGDAAKIVGFQGVKFPNSDGAFAFIAFNPSATTPALESENIQPRNGERFGAAFCSSAGVNDDWLISPKLRLPAENAKMQMSVKTYMADYGLEKYKVLVSESDNEVESFVEIKGTTQAPVEDWEDVEIDLSAYAGKEIYIAIQCVSEDAFVFMLDDIIVSKPTANEFMAKNVQLNVYPNPAKEMITIASLASDIQQVDIVSISGKVMFRSQDNLKIGAFRYNVRDLAKGVYFARVRTSQGIEVVKFIVQ